MTQGADHGPKVWDQGIEAETMSGGTRATPETLWIFNGELRSGLGLRIGSPEHSDWILRLCNSQRWDGDIERDRPRAESKSGDLLLYVRRIPTEAICHDLHLGGVAKGLD